MGYTSKSPKTGDSKTGGAAWQQLSVSSSTDEPWTDMEYIDLAIAVLKTQDPDLIHSLTDFLMVLPTPGHIEGVLEHAIDQLAQIDRNTHQWILDHSACLMPYVDLLQSQSRPPCVSPSYWSDLQAKTPAFLA
ncbi:hypothetical protein [Roseofilum capinflatum]|uniref:Uncharacterized protein n=1 Tax=Roseofilum capinflatum BLCC-M114 TaxID=3022440 RepID=A0ABT7B9U5_9CYAN|nr:hypothetical protein [Roseofilum capinflatum]MDJ1175931.1 hypothetical protein [Roseofilum capinflatum BLCC-M114]